MSTRTWSAQQTAIFDFLLNARGHLVVIARAGCGKTTTIVEAVLRWLGANPGRRVTVCAFNKKIEQELVTRFVGQPITVKTLHAIGFAAVRTFWPGIRINDAKKDPVSRVGRQPGAGPGGRAAGGRAPVVTTNRRKGDRRKPAPKGRERTAQEEAATDALEQFLDAVYGPDRGPQIPGHYGNGTGASLVSPSQKWIDRRPQQASVPEEGMVAEAGLLQRTRDWLPHEATEQAGTSLDRPADVAVTTKGRAYRRAG